MHLSLVLLELLRILFRIALAALCFRLLRSAWLARCEAPAFDLLSDDEAPSVTVQLPVKNEYFVAARALRATAALDYPRDRLEIQVIDQSDDETVQRVAEVARELMAQGINVTILRRAPGDGFKSDSLADGLLRSTSEFVAIFDADCVPQPDFLRRVLPRFTTQDVGLVQGRLSFANREASILTRAQAQLLDGLMLVDQAAEARRTNGTIHFNGTAGVWRRACIDDAGGWRRGSITEDVDISCRAIAAGWRLARVSDVVVSADLPETMSAFRVQQRRWTRGHMHVLRENLRAIRDRKSFTQRARALAHTARRSIFLALALVLVTWPLTTFNLVHPLVRYSTTHDVILFAAVTLSASIFLLRAERLAGRPLVRELLVLPATIALFFGMSVGCALSVFAGLARASSSFDRTPKSGATGDVLAPHYGSRFDAIAIVEIVVAIAYAFFAITAVKRGLYVHACWSVFVAAAYAWVGGSAVALRITSSSVASYRGLAAHGFADD